MKRTLIFSLMLLLIAPSLSLATNDSTCDEDLTTPVVAADINDDNIILSWDKIDHYDLAGYKLVISKEDETPEYPYNGYLTWITDRNTTSYTIDNTKAYHNGDINSYLENGEDYYFTITAVYNCGTKVTGNVLHLSYPGNTYHTSSCTDSDGGLDRYTKGTVSGESSDGEDYSTTDVCVGADLMEYHCNEYGSTATLKHCTYGCSNGACLTSNDSNTDDDTSDDVSTTSYPVPEVSAASSESGVLLTWDAIDHDKFTGYKVVVSKSQSKPKYPDHGYAKYITNPNTTSFLVNNHTAYNRGDFGGYLETGEDYYFSITALYGGYRTHGNVVEAVYSGPSHKAKPELYQADSLTIMKQKAQKLLANDLGDILAELQELRDKVKEQENELKYLRLLMTDVHSIAQSVKDTLNQFITYGVDENTKKLGEGERAAVIHSYKSAFNKLPETEDEVADAIKIANGRWPSMTNEAAEEKAKGQFKKIYLRDANMSNPNDNAAVTVMAYGLRQKAENRNLDSERQGIKTFKYIYGYTPASTEDWNIMQAITYSGATR